MTAEQLSEIPLPPYVFPSFCRDAAVQALFRLAPTFNTVMFSFLTFQLGYNLDDGENMQEALEPLIKGKCHVLKMKGETCTIAMVRSTISLLGCFQSMHANSHACTLCIHTWA